MRGQRSSKLGQNAFWHRIKNAFSFLRHSSGISILPLKSFTLQVGTPPWCHICIGSVHLTPRIWLNHGFSTISMLGHKWPKTVQRYMWGPNEHHWSMCFCISKLIQGQLGMIGGLDLTHESPVENPFFFYLISVAFIDWTNPFISMTFFNLFILQKTETTKLWTRASSLCELCKQWYRRQWRKQKSTIFREKLEDQMKLQRALSNKGNIL